MCARCVRSPDFHMLCGPALPEVKEQKNLTLGQQNRRACPPDSRWRRDLLFPTNDSTLTGSHRGGSCFRGESANANNGRDLTRIQR